MLTVHHFSDAYWQQLRRLRFFVEPPRAIELPPMEDLVCIDAVLTSDHRDGCAWLQCLFDDLTPLLLRAILTLRCRFVLQYFRGPCASHSPKITAANAHWKAV